MATARVFQRGFRLSNSDSYSLTWLFTQADAEISGLAGQRYEQVSGDTSIDRLFAQERLVGWGKDNIADYTRLTSIARLMASGEVPPGKDKDAFDPKRGGEYWGWLKRVYGVLQNRDPHDYFGRELAPLARVTPAALRRAEQRWPHWHCEKHAERYAVLYEQVRRESGALASIDRMMRLMPDSALAAGEAHEVMSDVLDGACARAMESDRPLGGKQLSPADEKLLRDVGRQADEMLSAAGLCFQEASWRVDEESEESEEARRERAAEADREKATESAVRIRNIDAVLEIDPAKLRAWFLGLEADEDDEQVA
jgi:hypothetical protein